MPLIEAPKALGAFPTDPLKNVWVLPFGLTFDKAVLVPLDLNYDLYIDTAETFSTPNAKKLSKTSGGLHNFSEGNGAGKAFEVQLPGQGQSDVTWYWQLRINDGKFFSPWSNIQNFTVRAKQDLTITQTIFDNLADANAYAKESNSSVVYKLLLQVGREIDRLLWENQQSISDLALNATRDESLVSNFSDYLGLNPVSTETAAQHRWKTYKLWKAFTNIPGTQQGIVESVVSFVAEPPTVNDLTTTEGWILDEHFLFTPGLPLNAPIATLFDRPTIGHSFQLIIFNSWNLTYDSSVVEHFVQRMKPAHSKVVYQYSATKHWALRYNLVSDWGQWANSGAVDTSMASGPRLSAGATSGVLTSPVERIMGAVGFDSPEITTDLSGQTITVEARTSTDGGTFGAWTALLHGTVPSTLLIHDYIQFRISFSRTSAGAPNPIMKQFQFNGIRS